MTEMNAEKKKALDAALAQIKKSFGAGAIMQLGEGAVAQKLDVVSTGSLAIDIATGVGGLPRGRVVEIYGPESSGKTTLTLETIAQAQKDGLVCAFIDAEHALDTSYAEKLGVDLSSLLISQPDNGEQALEIVDALVKSSAVDVIIVDSVAALTPKAEIEGDMGDSLPGLQARLMSQALRKLTATIKQTNCLVIFINQLRHKIGVMFGCFNYNARVLLEDGSSIKIGKLVHNKMDVRVLSYNTETGLIEPKRVINWFNNGKADKFYQIVVEGSAAGTRKLSGVTDNHVIFTPEGEKQVWELNEGDEVLARYMDVKLTDVQRKFVIGSALGDGSIRKINSAKAILRYGHGLKQKEYLLLKYQLLGNIAGKLNETIKRIGFDTYAYPSFLKLRDHFYGNNRHVSDEILNELDAMSIAFWYMDDGSLGGNHAKWGRGKVYLYNKSMPMDIKQKVLNMFKDRFGIEGSLINRSTGFVFYGEAAEAFQKLVAPYIHKSMSYKIAAKYQAEVNYWDTLDPEQCKATTYETAYPAKILKKYVKPATRGMNKFDIEVEGNHNYLVDGIVVHNSPETTTGGNALKFYASVRLDIRRIGNIKKGDEVIGSETQIKVVKNKVAPPFKVALTEIRYGAGFYYESELIDLAVANKIMDKSGTWYSYNGEKIGQGKDNSATFLAEHAELRDEIDQKIRSIYFNKVESAE